MSSLSCMSWYMSDETGDESDETGDESDELTAPRASILPIGR